MNKHLRNWLLYFCWLTLVEIITFCIILFEFPREQLEWWHFVAIQPTNHILALVFFVFTLAGIEAIKVEQEKSKWIERVNKMLTDYEKKEKENE